MESPERDMNRSMSSASSEAASPSGGTELVFHLFGGTGASYDEVVERTTMGMDSHWKRMMLREMEDPHAVLDLASGTGMLSFLIAERWPGCTVLGVDLQAEYVDIARERAKAKGLEERVRFSCSAAEDADYGVEAFDLVTTSYLPKYADLAVLVPKLHRAMVPGGRLVFHDFTLPGSPSVQMVWQQSFDDLLAQAEAAQSEWQSMFRGLPDVIRKSRWVEELQDHLAQHGFADIRARSLSMECAAIVIAHKA